MAYGDIPNEPAWGIEYRINPFQRCTFCQGAGCRVCQPQVRDGQTEKELLEEAAQCVKEYCKLRQHPNVWGKLGDLEQMLIVFAIDYGRHNTGENGDSPPECVDRFKELELR